MSRSLRHACANRGASCESPALCLASFSGSLTADGITLTETSHFACLLNPRRRAFHCTAWPASEVTAGNQPLRTRRWHIFVLSFCFLQDQQVVGTDTQHCGDTGSSLDDTAERAASADFAAAQEIPQNLTRSSSVSERPIRLTFIGRPNAGKSSLINSILREKRLAVSAAPGTTTDSVSIDFVFKKQQMALIDTAGVTRGWKMRGDDLLQQASLQTMRNVRGADVCVLCLDASQVGETGHISSNDLSLAHLATQKEGRCLLACATKWDLVDPSKRSHVRMLLLERLQAGLGHLKSCPVVFTSAAQGHNLHVLLNKALLVYKQWCSRVPTASLNAWLQQYTARWPPPWRLGSQCQVKYITQAQARPPTFVAWSNVYARFPTHYKRQLINAIREEFGMKGIPVRLVLRTTAMPKPGTRLTKAEVLKWKRLGPHQVRWRYDQSTTVSLPDQVRHGSLACPTIPLRLSSVGSIWRQLGSPGSTLSRLDRHTALASWR